MTTQFTIRASNVPFLQAKLAESNKKAAKLGVPAATMTVVGHTEQEIVIRNRGTGKMRQMAIVDVTGGVPVLAGWTLAGLLHHIATDEAGKDLTVQHTIRGMTIPVAYKNQVNLCEHCNTSRRRNTTFILSNVDGRFIQVGSSCLADFLGFNADPMALARFAEQFAMLEAACKEEDDKEVTHFVRGKTTFYGTHLFLAYTAATIRAYGWLSKGKAKLGNYGDAEKATANLAMEKLARDLMDPPPPAPTYPADIERVARLNAIVVTDADRTEADRIANYMAVYFDQQDEQGLGDYLSNLRLALFQSAIPRKLSGIVASTFAAYNRIQKDAELVAAKKEMEANPVAPKLAYVGEIGKRMSFQARVCSIRALENSVLVKLEDVDGNRLTWFASGQPNLEEGRIYDLVGTPQAHEEYKGLKGTRINRVVVAA